MSIVISAAGLISFFALKKGTIEKLDEGQLQFNTPFTSSSIKTVLKEISHWSVPWAQAEG